MSALYKPFCHFWMILSLMFVVSGCKLLEAVDEEADRTFDLTLIKQSVLLSGDERTLFVNLGDQGVDIIDVSDTKAPKIIKNYPTDDKAYGLWLHANRLYIANGLEGVSMLDVTNPVLPKLIASIRTSDDNATAVSVTDDGTKVAVGTSRGALLYALSSDSTPRYLDRYDTNGTLYDLRFSADASRLYLANFRYGLEVLDISKPTRIGELGALALEGSSCDIAPDDATSTLYMATLTSAVKRVDIAMPEEPKLLGVYDAHDGSLIWGIAPAGDFKRLYLAKGNRGLEILDNSNPEHPVQLGLFDTNGTARGVAINRAQTRAFVADGKEGLKIIDISDKSAPKRISVLNF